jgi:hypothetical protein
VARLGDHEGFIQVVEQTDHADVFETREVLVHGGVLAGESDVVTDLVGLLGDVKARHDRPPAGWRENGRQNPDHRRFARTVGPEESKDLTRGYVKGDIVERPDVASGEGAHDIEGFDSVFRHWGQFR